MLDTHAIARSLTDAGIEQAHADAITNAVRQAAEAPANMATAVDVADLRTEMAAMEGRIYRAMLIQAGAIVGAVVAVLRLTG